MRGLRRSALPATALVSALVVAGALAVGAGAGTDDPGEALLERARVAAAREDYVGVVEAAWRDGDDRRVVTAVVRSIDGVLELGRGRDRVVSRGLRRWETDDGHWEAVWGTERPADVPSPGAKWDLQVGDGFWVAGRPTVMVRVVDRRTGDVRARLYLDREAGLLLRREILDRAGDVERSVRFLRIDEPAPGARAARPPDGRLAVPDPLEAVTTTIEAPGRAGTGYRLAGVYERSDGTAQLLYSDGLFTVSVFEQDGELDWGALPASESTAGAGGADEEVAGQRVRTYSTPAGRVLVWEHEGRALTVVTDGPSDELVAVVRSFARHGGGGGSALDRIADFVLGPFGWE